MKKLLSWVLLLCMVLMSSYACAETAESEEIAPDFKSFYWGDSKETVMAVEGTPMLENELTAINAEYIAYEATAVGLDAALAYYFCDDGLFTVRYILAESHSNDSLYIDDYETFKSALTKKYGEPYIDLEDWENDSKKEYYADNKGDALNYGYLTYFTVFETDTSYIAMEMSADNYEITTSVTYESKEITAGEADYSDDI